MTEENAYDFEAIEAAVKETDRGRWFLAEFARRQKNADTGTLLEAIHKLEAAIGKQPSSDGNEALARELSAMAEALKATETDMRKVANDGLADGGAVPSDKTAFEDVCLRAKNLAAGLNATTEALKSASDNLKQDSSSGDHIAALDDDLARLAEHNVTQDVLSQRIGKAMDLIVHLQERIQANLGPHEAPQGETSSDGAKPDEALSAGEISYFDADRELFTAPPQATPAPAPELAADDPENAPHLADMLEDALASMQLGGNAEPPASEALEAPQADAPPPAPVEADVQPAQEPEAVADKAPASDEAPKSRRVVIVREAPAAAPTPAPEAAAPCAPTGRQDEQAPAAEEPEAAAQAPVEQAAPASMSEEEAGPEAIMKMFTEAAARHGMQPAAPDAPPAGDSEAKAPSDGKPGEAAQAKEVQAAPLEPMTPDPEERRRIVVIRRGSSADTHIPLEESEDGGAEAKA